MKTCTIQAIDGNGNDSEYWELLPCPFCSSYPFIHTNEDGIECVNCACSMNRGGYSFEEIVEQWNRRIE